MNCHGCKWLDRYKTDGNGYCAMVKRSKTFRGQYTMDGRLMPGSSVRKSDMERCGLYEPGDFATRYQNI